MTTALCPSAPGTDLSSHLSASIGAGLDRDHDDASSLSDSSLSSHSHHKERRKRRSRNSNSSAAGDTLILSCDDLSIAAQPNQFWSRRHLNRFGWMETVVGLFVGVFIHVATLSIYMCTFILSLKQKMDARQDDTLENDEYSEDGGELDGDAYIFLDDDAYDSSPWDVLANSGHDTLLFCAFAACVTIVTLVILAVLIWLATDGFQSFLGPHRRRGTTDNNPAPQLDHLLFQLEWRLALGSVVGVLLSCVVTDKLLDVEFLPLHLYYWEIPIVLLIDGCRISYSWDASRLDRYTESAKMEQSETPSDPATSWSPPTALSAAMKDAAMA